MSTTTHIPAQPRTSLATPSEADVAHLTDERGGPCLSVVMATRPGPRLTDEDLERLLAMTRYVSGLLAEQEVPGHEQLLERLRDLVHQARTSPAEEALCLFVSDRTTSGFVLPVPVTDKAVVEPTFATRDLVRFLHRTPPHLVLRLDRFGARFLRVVGTSATQLRHVDQLPDGRSVRVGPRVPGRPDELLDDFLEEVEETLGDLRRTHPSPLVLAGERVLVQLFVHRSRHLRRLAGMVLDERAHSPRSLVGEAALELSDYLDARGAEALGRLRDVARHEPHRVVPGIDAAWHVATEAPESFHRRVASMLVVEEGYTVPSTVGDADPSLGLGDGEDRHDLVDDLIELVISEGGQLALVPDGSLAEHGRVALIVAPADG